MTRGMPKHWRPLLGMRFNESDDIADQPGQDRPAAFFLAHASLSRRQLCRLPLHVTGFQQIKLELPSRDKAVRVPFLLWRRLRGDSVILPKLTGLHRVKVARLYSFDAIRNR